MTRRGGRAAVAGLRGLALLLACGASLAVAGPPDPVQLTPGSPTVPLGRVEGLFDPGATLGLADVLGSGGTARFERLDSFPGRGYTDGASWLRFAYLTPYADAGEWFLRIAPSMLDDVSVHVEEGPDPSSVGSYRRYQVGDRFPASGRPVRSRDMVVPLPSALAPRTVYVRVRTTSTHQVRLSILRADELVVSEDSSSFESGLKTGLFAVVFLVCAFYSALARDPLFGTYALFILAGLARQTGLEGTLFIVWPSAAHLLSDWCSGAGVGLGVATYALFAIRLFETRTAWPRTHRVLQAVVVLGVLTTLAIPFGWYGRVAPLALASFLPVACVTTAMAFSPRRRREPGGGLLLVGFATMVAFSLPRVLGALGLVHEPSLAAEGSVLALVVQAVVMTLALLRRLHVTREEALSVTRLAEHRATELARERTLELTESNRRLREAVRSADELAERAEAASRAKGEFVARISHEVRTPMNAVVGLTDLALDAGPGAERRDYLEKIRASARALVGLIDGVLDFSRLDAGRFELARVPFRLDQLLALVASRTRVEAEAKGLSFEPRVDPALPRGVVGDPARLGQVLRELAANAVKFTAQGGVTLEAGLAGDGEGEARVRFTVRDTGIGMSPAARDRLFQPFTQGDGSTTRRYPGVGLGLAIARKLVERMGGELGVESVEGRGSTFRFDLGFPVVSAAPSVLDDVAAADGLESVSGIDLPEVLARIGGNRKLLGTLLREFREMEVGVVPALRGSLEARDFEGARRAAHTLRGMAANLSMGDVTVAAAALGEALRARDAAASSRLVDALAAALSPVLAGIAALPAARPAGGGVPPADRAELAARLEELGRLLRDSDLSAGRLFAGIDARIPPGSCRPLRERLAREIERMEFDDAARTAAELAGALGAEPG